ncbi:hypothetical protein CKO43_17890 [Rubrivivax gelatinosus]|uniref:Uncharacterized protein n=1 Tax=Rubrivivax gelatinosus TaxID=28068 RepID=A0ABS1DX78_RUBGE|nr:hypothetical protein [Rubrivivax gelatinosus]
MLVSTVARDAPAYLTWLATKPKARGNPGLLAALAAHLPAAIVGAAEADRRYREAQDAEAERFRAWRRSRIEARQAAKRPAVPAVPAADDDDEAIA